MATEPRDLLPLPHLSYLVLLALAEGDAHGWAVIKRIRRLTGGGSNPSAGSLYLAMLRLDERGLLAERAAPTRNEDARRRHYGLTELGRDVLAAESQRLAGLVAAASRLGVLDAGAAEARRVARRGEA
jgi:DNA-binding PadR family transcriptional regulator